MKIDLYDETYNVHIEKDEYMDNHTLVLSLVCDDGEPFARLTVNLPETDFWGSDTVAFVDTNNCPWAEKFIEENDLGSPMGITARSGFCTYPLYHFNLQKIGGEK